MLLLLCVCTAVLDQLAMAALQEALEGEDRDNLELSIMLALSCDVIEGEELLNQAVVRLDFLKVKHCKCKVYIQGQAL